MESAALRLGVGVWAMDEVGDRICWAASASSSASKLLSSLSAAAVEKVVTGDVNLAAAATPAATAEVSVVSGTEMASGVVMALSLIVSSPFDFNGSV